MATAPNPNSEGVTLTVNLSEEAYSTLQAIAAIYGETITVALHRCIATTYDLQQRAVQKSDPGPSSKSWRAK